MNNKNQPASPKMTKAQARAFWNALTPEQKSQFNELMYKLNNKQLVMTNVLVDDDEQIQRIILDDKNRKTSKADKPFYKHFNLEKK